MQESDTPIRVESLIEAQRVMARALDIGEWERSMTHSSLLEYLREEAAEFAEAVQQWSDLGSTPDTETALRKELSDLLLQVLFHAELARRRKAFDLDDVAASFVAKMRSRAPYLFEDGCDIVPISEQDRLWGEGKLKERRNGPAT